MTALAWFDWVGFAGVGCVLGAYLALTLGKLSAARPPYLLLNAIGSALLLVSLAFAFNLSAVVIQVFWIAISVIGLARYARGRSRGRAAAIDPTTEK